eukprot:1188447-Rhodomonas_salina.1
MRPGHEAAVRLLIARGADVNKQGDFQQTALHLACYNGDPYTVQALLDAGADTEIKNQRRPEVATHPPFRPTHLQRDLRYRHRVCSLPGARKAAPRRWRRPCVSNCVCAEQGAEMARGGRRCRHQRGDA